MRKSSNTLTLKDLENKLYGNTFVINNKVYLCEPGHPGFVTFCTQDGISNRLQDISLDTCAEVLNDTAISVGKGSSELLLYPMHYLRVSFLEETSYSKPEYVLITIEPQYEFLIGHTVQRINGAVSCVVNSRARIASKSVRVVERLKNGAPFYMLRLSKTKNSKDYTVALDALDKSVQPFDIHRNADTVNFFKKTVRAAAERDEGDYKYNSGKVSFTVSVYKRNPGE